jgi:glutamyl-tRNA reductase
MKLVLVGANHKSAPVDVREMMSLSEGEASNTLRELLEKPWIEEAYLLSTCNRVEYLIYGNHYHKCIESVLSCIFRRDPSRSKDWEKWIYVLRDEEAVRHLFTVASSMDSMIIGEPQILGQVKDAYRLALKEKSCGAFLNKLLHQAFRVAKRIRTQTDIGKSAVSVSYAAVELAKSIFQDLTAKTILLVGSGEMIELAATHFVQSGIKSILVTSRTFENAQLLAGKFSGRALPFEELPRTLPMADIVLSCTAAPTPIITFEDIKMAMKMRRQRPMFIIDIAVPRDVEPAVNKLENVYLYDIDDLKDVVDQNIEKRRMELSAAQKIIDEEVEKFIKWKENQQAIPIIKALTSWAEEIRKRELKKTLNTLGDVSEKQKEALDAMTRAMVKKLLHRPISSLKENSDPDRKKRLMEAIHEIFDLHGRT